MAGLSVCIRRTATVLWPKLRHRSMHAGPGDHGFEVLLPAILEPAAEADDTSGGGSDSQGTDRLEAIMLVEDETSLRAPVAKMLQKRGHSVIEAGNGLAAIEIFRARAPEIGWWFYWI